jgi:hypothetical protein
MLLGVFEVLLDVSLRIYDRGLATARIRDQIRRVCQTAQVVLLEDHGPGLVG